MASEFSESKMEGEIIIGAIDAITKAYIRKNEVFADAFNYFMYDGAQVIQPEQLFCSSLREVMGCIKYSKDKRKLADFISNNPRMNMELTAARVIEAINHVPIKIEEGVDRFDMCQAIEEMIEDGRKEERHRINQLNILLSEKNRTEDIVKAALDKEYQEQLLKEFDIE